jgi:Uma2 family endonuclease
MIAAEALEELRHSPRLPEIYQKIGEQLKEEHLRRQQFYRDMTPEQKIEFIDGEVILHSPARNRHLRVTKQVLRLLDIFVIKRELGLVQSEQCLTVFPRNDYEPDIVFFGSEKAATLSDRTFKFPVPDLVVEIFSSSTESRDRGIKFTDYAANGVAEYWIIDAENNSLEQYLLEGDDYHLQLKSGSGILKSPVITGFEIPLEAIFDELANLDALEKLIAKRAF